ncbi:hypothetical protein PL11_002755 [Lentilactobacillus curieae]|uniref:Uncharacterized protein n=1 Tax=Lentilactobacillus curieae TaxID=1138822 RepID=A0A1S6QH33_9LACO|nr:hypothetical protein PL11_002755 [Lentilactobacillus curieae]
MSVYDKGENTLAKQGKYAKSSKQKQIKQILKAKRKPQERTINDSEFEDFMLVRYGLTLKKKLKLAVRESMQRFLQQWIVIGQDQQVWSIEELLPQVLQQINVGVPWQFYEQIADNFSEFQGFLNRELKAVPLKERKTISDELDASGVNEIIAGQLAANTFIATLGGNQEKLQQVTQEQLEATITSFSNEGTIDWEKVRGIFEPLGFDVPDNFDVPTKKWLQMISEK